MGRKKSATSDMNVMEKQLTPLAQRLSDLITDANALKDHLGVSTQAINQYKLGLARPSLENLCKIARFYGVSTDYLLGFTETPSVDEDIQATYKTTGLTEDAIQAIKKLKEHKTINILNQILKNEKFVFLIAKIHHLSLLKTDAIREDVLTVKIEEVLTVEKNRIDEEKMFSGLKQYIRYDEQLDLIKFRLGNDFQIIVDAVSDQLAKDADFDKDEIDRFLKSL